MTNDLFNMMKEAMQNIPEESKRWDVRVDADFHKTALLEVMTFIGHVLEKGQSREHPDQYTRDNINSLAYFLQSAPELIRSMDAVLEVYDNMAATAQGGCHE